MEMPYDPLEERKQNRDKVKQARLQRQKTLLIRLAIAGGVLMACAVLILIVIFSGGKDQPEQTQPSTLQTTAPDSTAGTQTGDTQPGSAGTDPTDTNPTGTAPAPTDDPTTQTEYVSEKRVIHIASVGDLNITDRVVAAGGDNFDYTGLFMDVLPLLSAADLTTVNLEGNFYGAPYGTRQASAPHQLLTALSNAGVDLIQMANSYSIKNGISGLVSTLQYIEAAGLEPMGAYESNAEFNRTGGYNIRTVNGVKVAFVAFTKGMDGMALPRGNEKCVNLLYTDYSAKYHKVDTQRITSILKAVKKEKPDIIIAMLHWGSEYNDIHSKTQENIKKLFLEQGVDVIIGTHPHYVQQIEFDRDSGTLVAYSLGDFVSDADKGGTEYSIVLDLEITKDMDTGETKVTNYSYTPIFTVSDEPTLRVVRVGAAMAGYERHHIARISEETYTDMQYALERIAVRVVPPAVEEEKK